MLKTKKSRGLFAIAQKILVGGVNSPVRAFQAVGGTPLFIRRAKGARVWDVDGNSFIDFVGSWGPMILGHGREEVLAAVRPQIGKGTSFGAPSEPELELARLICRAVPSIEKVRLVSSGTEAVMSAIRLARGFTGRSKIVKFAGCYHGHADSLLVQAGSGAATLGVPDSRGVPASFVKETLVLPYNDATAVRDLFRREGKRIAAAIVEPVSGNMGVVLPRPGFLEALRSATSASGSLLVFDEVMTGFRLAMGGAQEVYGVRPDLTTLGKIIGGGFPVGALGGKAGIMDHLSPLGAVYQAGTLSGNPVAAAAGAAVLKSLLRRPPYREMEKRLSSVLETVRQGAMDLGVPIQINQAGSMFTLFFAHGPVTDYASARKSDASLYGKFFHHLLGQGVYFPPSQFEAAFISTAHDAAVLKKAGDAILRALEKSVRKED